ncbi:MAG: C39 family peptidase [bacterium]|nr:C39 family peptidase [bacterium]
MGMKNKYKIFNLVCLLSSLVFVLSILWLWRDNTKNFNDENTSAVQNVLRPMELRKLGNIALDSEIPNEINLPVPFTSQAPEKNWDQPWQDACEEAVVLMFDAYYKEYNLSPLFARDEIIKMVDWQEQKGWGLSIEIEKVKELTEDYSNNLKTKIIENPTVDQIKRIIASGNIVLVVADGKVLPNPHFSNGGPEYHALIIRGYTDKTFITNDPGTQFGENFEYKYNDLMNAIHDWNDGNVTAGKKVILVIDKY